MTSLSALVAGLAAVAQAGQQAPVLTIDEALQIAEQNAFSVRSFSAQVERAKGRYGEVRGLIGPRLTATGTYQRNDEEISQEGEGGESFVVQPIERKTVGLQVTMPLDITGTLGKGVAGAKANVRASEANLKAERNTLRLNVRAAYYAALRAEALVQVAERTLASAEKRLEDEKRREQAGVSARVDVLRFQTQAAQARSGLVAAQNGVVIAKESLNNTLGRPIETQYQLSAPTALPSVVADEAALAKTAVARRPEVIAVRETREALAWVRRAQEGGLLPSLNVAANYNKTIDGTDQSGRDHSLFGTLTVSWPLFDSGVTRARVKQARQDEEIARIQQEQIELGISLEVRQAVSNLVTAKTRLDVAAEQEQLAAETHRLAQVRLDAGEGTSLEVTDALTELTLASVQLANARFDYLTAYAQLQRAVAADDPAAATASETK